MDPTALIGIISHLAGAGTTPSCEDLRGFRAHEVTVLEAEMLDNVCRLEGVVTPVEGSRIGFHLKLPQAGQWNARLKMLGNGGYSSAIPLKGLEALSAAGYAAVATDTGHSGDDPNFVVGHPEALTDWASRAVHVTAGSAKAIVETYYGSPPEYSYFEGCSTGGHQAFSEVQRYPEDFDGVIAGAPGHNRIRLNAAFLNQFLVNRDPRQSEVAVLDQQSLRLLAKASLAVCDIDLSTPYIDDPLSCKFDPAVIACDDQGTGPNCLTPKQVEVARTMYGGTRDPDTNELIYPGWLPGSEAGGPVPDHFPGWSLYWADTAKGNVPARQSFWRFWVFGDPTWTWERADLGTDVAYALEMLGADVDATDTDISSFAEFGGKLLHYHGLADPVVSPRDSIAYHDAVTASLGESTADFYRLFLLPGVEHCQGGAGPADFSGQSFIEDWVERGIPPDLIDVTYDGGDGSPIERLTPYNNGD